MMAGFLCGRDYHLGMAPSGPPTRGTTSRLTSASLRSWSKTHPLHGTVRARRKCAKNVNWSHQHAGWPDAGCHSGDCTRAH